MRILIFCAVFFFLSIYFQIPDPVQKEKIISAQQRVPVGYNPGDLTFFSWEDPFLQASFLLFLEALPESSRLHHLFYKEIGFQNLVSATEFGVFRRFLAENSSADLKNYKEPEFTWYGPLEICKALDGSFADGTPYFFRTYGGWCEVSSISSQALQTHVWERQDFFFQGSLGLYDEFLLRLRRTANGFFAEISATKQSSVFSELFFLNTKRKEMGLFSEEDLTQGGLRFFADLSFLRHPDFFKSLPESVSRGVSSLFSLIRGDISFSASLKNSEFQMEIPCLSVGTSAAFFLQVCETLRSKGAQILQTKSPLHIQVAYPGIPQKIEMVRENDKIFLFYKSRLEIPKKNSKGVVMGFEIRLGEYRDDFFDFLMQRYQLNQMKECHARQNSSRGGCPLGGQWEFNKGGDCTCTLHGNPSEIKKFWLEKPDQRMNLLRKFVEKICESGWRLEKKSPSDFTLSVKFTDEKP